MTRITFVGSLEALRTPGVVPVGSATRVAVLVTAAAFRGPAQAVTEVADLAMWDGATLFGVSVLDRRSANDADTLVALANADLVVLADGAVLHARSVWRGSTLAEVMSVTPLLAIGAVGSVLGATMIDPRGGAPTTGVGLFDDAVITVPTSPEQMTRTRELVGDQTLVELGPGAIVVYDGDWHILSDIGLVVTRAGVAVRL